MRKVTLKNLKPVDRELLLAAKAAMETAYNPYSKFFVGSALLTKDGEIVSGSNFENASYGLTICAERAAIVRASAMGCKVFNRIAVIGRGASEPMEDIISPCGICRQMIFEASHIAGRSIEVIMSSTSMKKIVVATIQELLPLGFGPGDLGLNLKRFKN